MVLLLFDTTLQFQRHVLTDQTRERGAVVNATARGAAAFGRYREPAARAGCAGITKAQLLVDYIIPRSFAPEVDNVIANRPATELDFGWPTP